LSAVKKNDHKVTKVSDRNISLQLARDSGRAKFAPKNLVGCQIKKNDHKVTKVSDRNMSLQLARDSGRAAFAPKT